MNVDFDSKKFSSVAVPTAIAAAAGGAIGYNIPKMVNSQGQASDTFVSYAAAKLNANDVKLMQEADSLDKINPVITEEEVAKLKGDENKILKFKEQKLAKANAALEKFVAKNAEILGVVPEEGQTLKDAVKAYLKDKSVADVKEAFLPESTRNMMAEADYVDALKEEFAEVYDSAAKKFKTGEGVEESVKFFKKVARNMKLTAAASVGAVTAAIALVSSVIASKIASK